MARHDDCPRPATARDNREYEAEIERRGGRKSPGGRAYIEAEHRRFKASKAAHDRRHGFWHSLWH